MRAIAREPLYLDARRWPVGFQRYASFWVSVRTRCASWGDSSAASAHARSAGATPNHAIVCQYRPDVPYQYGSTAPISAEAHITCSPDAPDVSSTTIRIWRHDFGRNKEYLFAEKTTNQRGTNWWISTSFGCTSSRIVYGFHTEIINQSFHGTWGYNDVNTIEVRLTC